MLFSTFIVRLAVIPLILALTWLLRNGNPSKGRSLRALLADGAVLTILPGELPGYSGWFRPSVTTAPLYEILYMSPDLLQVDRQWRVRIQCKACSRDNPFFYMRAYGPAVIAGTIDRVDHPSLGTFFDAYFYPRDPGSYTVELVLTFSDAPQFNAFPLPKGVKEPGFEGINIQGFPRQITVEGAKPVHPDKQCTNAQLTNETIDARWKVVERTPEKPAFPDGSNKDWVEPRSMTGIHMEYQYPNCRMLDMNQIRGHLFHLAQKRREQKLNDIHIVMIGDSVMGLQHKRFNELVEGIQGIKTTLISNIKGLAFTLERHVARELKNLGRISEPKYVLFNSGLHDITQLCTQVLQKVRSEYLDYSEWPSESQQFSCTEMYSKKFFSFTRLIAEFSANLRVFQSTTAAWPVYGMMEVTWKDNYLQPFSTTPHMVSKFNEIAFESVHHFGTRKISVMDGFQLTRSRPDNRQIQYDNAPGGKFAHPGKEVLDTMVQTWANILVNQIEEEMKITKETR
jgi:hypothetical protein